MTSYYDIQAILAEEERIPVTFRTGVTGAGRALDPSCDDDDLAENAKVDLPFWLVPALVTRHMIIVRQPRFYGERVRKEIYADASCVNLRECSLYYYELGIRIAPMVYDRTLGAFLLEAFRGRFTEVLAKCHSLSDETMTRNRLRLTKEEQRLLQAGHQSTLSFMQWMQRNHNVIKKASILGKTRRRREVLGRLDINTSSDSSKRTHYSNNR